MQCSRLVSLLSFSSLLYLAPLGEGQRLKRGCFDAAPITCNSSSPDGATLALDVADKVCKRIVFELLPLEDLFMFETDQHAQYLNSIEAESEFCSQIRLAYPRCFFCIDFEDYGIEAINLAMYPNCAGKPDLETILADEGYRYAEFKTKQDIDETCNLLEKANTLLFPERGYLVPGTIDLARKKVLMVHLCPGICDGNCFHEEIYPPTCDPGAFSGPFNTSEHWDPFTLCQDYILPGLASASLDDMMNISTHVDYLRFIQENTTECNQARQAYSSCVFCAEQLCFAEPNLPSCSGPPDNSTGLQIEEGKAQSLCQEIYWQMYGGESVLFNVSSHSNSILIGNNNPLCELARSVYHQCYWCVPDPHEEFCLAGAICHNLENVSLPDDFENALIPKLNLTHEDLDCGLAYDRWRDNWFDPYLLQGCYEHIDLHQRCPIEFCVPEDAQGFENYLGTTSTAQRKALIWASRVSALLSFFGACFILYDILSHPQLRKNVYHQLLTGMAIFDIITALAWSFATAPIDAEKGYYVEGAVGTEETCTAQAICIQVGFGSIFYNVSLGLYYVLVVVYGWREFQLKKIRLWMHLCPLLLGFGLALGAITSYNWFEYSCHIMPTDDVPVLVFIVIPLGMSIAAITLCMFMVYWKVRKQAAASKKWSLGVGKASQMEQAVFWQCICYGLAFYISWPILFAVYLFSIDENGPFGLALTVAFVAPLQGFNNFLVYVRGKRSREGRGRGHKTHRRPLATVIRLFDRRSTINSLSGSMQTNGTRPQQNSMADPSVAIAMEVDEAEATPNNEVADSEVALAETLRCINGLRAESNSSRLSNASFADDAMDEESEPSQHETAEPTVPSTSKGLSIVAEAPTMEEDGSHPSSAERGKDDTEGQSSSQNGLTCCSLSVALSEHT